MTGPILLIDLWSGFSGASIAMLSLGVKIYVLAAESNPDVAKMAEASLDQIVHVPAVELIDARMIEGIMKKRSIQAIVVGGGSPCQGNTSLNKGRKGLDDPRSLQPNELVRIRDELRRKYPKTPVLTFLENVASAPEQVKTEYDKLMGVHPVRIDAGIFGWVQRKRLYWASGPRGEDVAWQTQVLPDDVKMTWDKDKAMSMISYKGKPIPRNIRTHDGFHWNNKKPDKVVLDGGDGAMYPFTREFRHPNDPTRAKWETVQRWQRDDKRFPVDAYSENNLLWRGEEWRTPTSTERAQAHGCPPAAVKPGYAATRTSSRERRPRRLPTARLATASTSRP